MVVGEGGWAGLRKLLTGLGNKVMIVLVGREMEWAYIYVGLQSKHVGL